MSSTYDYIEQISASKTNWKILAMVLQLWKIPHKENNDTIVGIGMVLIDKKDATIEAYIKEDFVLNFIDVLEEKKAYVFVDFKVLTNDGSYKASKH
ncbi:hypothetical protein M5689_010908 [Euphorbia peplus]|nr:hypothetical protein M5689_010908 [Euphorbia peplus]